MPNVENDLRRNVLGRATQGVGAVPGLETLYEPKISQLYITIILHQYVFRLQISIDEVLTVHVLENENDLGAVEAYHCCRHASDCL